jgi:hypothetical protein
MIQEECSVSGLGHPSFLLSCGDFRQGVRRLGDGASWSGRSETPSILSSQPLMPCFLLIGP